MFATATISGGTGVRAVSCEVTRPTTKPPPLNVATLAVPRTSTGPSTPPPFVPEAKAQPELAHSSNLRAASEEPMSVPEIDISELSDRAEQSGDIEVDIDDSAPIEVRTAPTRAQTAPPMPPPGKQDAAHAPPPTPAVAKAPPAPPQAKKPQPTPSSAATAAQRAEGKGAGRGKPWFVDLFDEDYLRTLPFLTPQATQSEAEFVIEAMSLAPPPEEICVP